MIWHSSTIEETSKELNTDITSGLNAADAELRIKEYGKNELEIKDEKGLAKHLLSGLNKVLIISLIIVAAINLLLAFSVNLNHKSDDLIIILLTIFGTLLISFFKYIAESTLKRASKDVSSVVTVIRNGSETQISSSELVPGDIMLIKSGDYIKADGRLIDSYALTCEEYVLSGDTAPSEKIHDVLFEDITPLSNRHNMVYSGSMVLNGHGTVIVTETGLSTEVGKRKDISKQLERSDTELATKLNTVKRIASNTALAVSILIFFVGIIANFSNTNVSFAVTVFSNILLALCVAFAASADIIPSILIFARACAMQRLKNKGVTVCDSASADQLKDVTVICTDKTGVLTTEELSVVRIFNGVKTVDLKVDACDESSLALLRLALICSNFSRNEHDERHTNNIERSIEAACIKYVGVSKTDIDGMYPKIAELPFSSERMLMTTVTAINGNPVSITKGAPETIISRCVNINSDEIDKITSEYAKEGLRVIAIAIKQLNEIPANPNSDELENELTFVGVLGIEDNISNEAAKLCKESDQFGIKTVVVTGDHFDTAVSIAIKAGIISDSSQAISGEELSQLTDAELFDVINNYSVFARVTPEDKLRIVSAFKAHGEKVLVTGDSINDTQALLEADYGCALGMTASDIVKDSADVIVDDNRFSSIILAIKESAKVFVNTKKALSYLISVSVSILLTVLFGLIVFGATPLPAATLVFLGVFLVILPFYAIFTDNAKKEFDMNSRCSGLFDKLSIARISAPSLIVIIISLLGYGFNLSKGVMTANSVAFTVIVFGLLSQAVSIICSNTLFSKKIVTRKNSLIICLIAFAFFILFSVTPIGKAISVGTPTVSGWIFAICAGLAVLILNEILKFIQKKSF